VQEIFVFSKTFRLALGLIHPAIEQISELFLGLKQLGANLTTYLHLVLG